MKNYPIPATLNTPTILSLLALFLLHPDSFSLGQEPASKGDRPNIIFILADDLGWGDLRCYGSKQARTPTLDRLAREGTLFTQFYVNGSVCSPSRAAFMTGQYPARNGVHGHFASHQQNQQRGMPNWLDPEVHTLTALLKQAGYATGHFGKWHLGSGEKAPSPGAYGIDDHRTLNANGPGWGKEQGAPYFRARSTRLFVEEALRFMKEHEDGPFFINIWTLLTHATLNPTEEELQPYKNMFPLGTPYKGASAIYLASVAALDSQLAPLFKYLDDNGLSENTLVLFTSDNGPEDIHVRNAAHSGIGSPGPFRGRKRSLYEGGVRVPFIVRWPGRVPAGRVNDTSVLSAVDFLPTLCRLAGIDLPEDLQTDGEEVSDILLGSSRERARPLFWDWRFGVAGRPFHTPPRLAMREGKWKLFINPDGSRVELYDIPAQPMEMDNLADRYPDIVNRMSKELLAWESGLPKSPIHPSAGRIPYRWPTPQKGTTP